MIPLLLDHCMPYEYRNLSPKQRKELIAYRKAFGYPLHAPPHPFRDKGYYLLTAVNYEHARIMEAPERRTEFETHLVQAFHQSETIARFQLLSMEPGRWTAWEAESLVQVYGPDDPERSALFPGVELHPLQPGQARLCRGRV